MRGPVEPAQENRFFAAVDKFANSDVFKTFEGRMLINAHAANGTAPQSFLLQLSMKIWRLGKQLKQT